MNVARTSRRRSTLPSIVTLATVADVRTAFASAKARLGKKIPDLAALDPIPAELLSILSHAAACGATNIEVQAHANHQDMSRWSAESRAAARFDRTFLVYFEIDGAPVNGQVVLEGKAPLQLTIRPLGYGGRPLHDFVHAERTSLQSGPLAIGPIASDEGRTTLSICGLVI